MQGAFGLSKLREEAASHGPSTSPVCALWCRTEGYAEPTERRIGTCNRSGGEKEKNKEDNREIEE